MIINKKTKETLKSFFFLGKNKDSPCIYIVEGYINISVYMK